jgi:hypothetical protein
LFYRDPEERQRDKRYQENVSSKQGGYTMHQYLVARARNWELPVMQRWPYVISGIFFLPSNIIVINPDVSVVADMKQTASAKSLPLFIGMLFKLQLCSEKWPMVIQVATGSIQAVLTRANSCIIALR